MSKNNQLQKAGNNSTQVQIKKVENHYGIDINEVKKIVQNEINIAIEETSLVAESIARNRLNDFAEIFLPKLVKSNLIECFSEPAIQIFFRNVEKTAICTDNKNCYEILSELLIHRVHKGNDFVTVAATNKAIEVVDKISDEALLFLTIFLCVDQFIPSSGIINEGLKTLDNLYEVILGDQEIPYNNKIIDNLEIIGAIRQQSFLTYKSFDVFFPDVLNGYSCAGIDKNSENYSKAIELLKKAEIDESSIISDSLIDNHVRLNVVNKSMLKELDFTHYKIDVTNILEKIYNLYDISKENVITAKSNFLNLIKNYKNIIKVKNWWDSNIKECGLCITALGKVLAHTNAKSLYSNFPDLD